jgi:uncharacterized protein (DUF983 family)
MPHREDVTCPTCQSVYSFNRVRTFVTVTESYDCTVCGHRLREVEEAKIMWQLTLKTRRELPQWIAEMPPL